MRAPCLFVFYTSFLSIDFVLLFILLVTGWLAHQGIKGQGEGEGRGAEREHDDSEVTLRRVVGTHARQRRGSMRMRVLYKTIFSYIYCSNHLHLCCCCQTGLTLAVGRSYCCSERETPKFVQN